MLKILYIGSDAPGSTSLYRAMAIGRRGHQVIIANPNRGLADVFKSKIKGAFHYRTGYRFLQGRIMRWITEMLNEQEKPDIVWVDSGELLGPACVRRLKQWAGRIILYNHDDPTGERDGHRFDSLKKAIQYYDLCVVVREPSYHEFKAAGSENVLKVYRSYDELMHKPFEDADRILPQFRSDIAFIGTWMKGEDRDSFLLTLIKKGLPVSIWGDHWQKSPLWNELKDYYKGKALSGKDYVAAVQGARICIGMLSKGNRDLHTTRSAEIPYIGGLFCAERTSEHEHMYKDWEEAVFWDDVEECARHCTELLKDENMRQKILLAGMKRVRALRIGNEDICEQALQLVQCMSK